MNSPTHEDGFFKELDFYSRRSAALEVGVTFTTALELQQEVPEKVLRGADESIEALKKLISVRKWKSR
jgi:hypothetical protein